MVQKSFFELVRHDIMSQAQKSESKYPKDLSDQILAAKGNDRAV